VQGDYGLNQCSVGCHDTLYPNEELVRMNRDYPESELLKERFLPFTEDISMIFKRLTL
jgi:hypothetical protein